MNMNFNEETYKQMLACFRTTDLQNLLGAFGRNKAGRKAEMKERALEILRSRPMNFNIQAFLAKIADIYGSMQSDMPNPNMMQNTMQRPNMMNMAVQDNTQRLYHAPPPYTQSLHNMTRAGLPQVMPQVQRGMYGNNNYPFAYQQNGSRRIMNQTPANQMIHMTTTDPMGFDINALNPGNNSNLFSAPPAPSLANINFKKLPFYEMVGEIIKPTTLVGQDRCSLQNVVRGMREAVFKFVLSVEHASLIAENRDISNHLKVEYTYTVQLRICLHDTGVTELSDFMPLNLHIRVNNKACQLPPSAPNVRPGTEARRSPRPISISHNLKLNPTISNTVIVNWTPDGKTYVIGLSLVKVLSSEVLLQRLKEKGARSSEETRDYIIKKLADVDPDLATTSYRFSLVCPLGKMRMKMPAKSVNCDHLQCFDASIFILMNEKKPTWLCPTCNKSCLYDDIEIQNYFLEVVTSKNLSSNSREIEILADGSWRMYEDLEDKEISAEVKETPIDSVNLDSDDETVDLKKEHKPESSKENENLKSSFVDLTLSEDEEQSTEKEKHENEAQAADVAQPVPVVDSKPQFQVQPQQAVTSSDAVIEIDSPSPPTTPTPAPTTPTPTNPTPTTPPTTSAS